MSLIGFLVMLVVLVVVIYGLKIVIGMLELTAPIQQLVWLIVAVVVLILLLQAFGLFGGSVRLPSLR